MSGRQQLCLLHRDKRGSSLNEETKKQALNERTGEISRKTLNEMEASKLPDTEFKTIMRTLKELRTSTA